MSKLRCGPLRVLLVAVVLLVLSFPAAPAGTVAAKPQPSGSFVTPSNIDSTSGTIRLYDSSTSSLQKTINQVSGRGQIQGLTLGPDGNIFGSFFNSATNTNGQILRISPNRVDVFVQPGVGGLVAPAALTFGTDNNLYVINQRGSLAPNILKFNGSTGAFIGIFATGLSGPQDLVFGPDGHLYVSNANADSISRFNGTSGSSLGTFVAPGSGGLDGPIGMAFGPNGDLFVTSAFTNKVLRFDGVTGAFLADFALLPVGAEGPTDLVWGPDGNLYVTGRVGAYPTTTVYRFNRTSGQLINEFVSGVQGLNTGLFFADPACADWPLAGSASGCFSRKLSQLWLNKR